MSDANSLLPCPFCGSENVSADEILGISDGKTFSQAQCLDCLATGPETPCDTCDPRGELAAGTWNCRAAPVSAGADAKDAARYRFMRQNIDYDVFKDGSGHYFHNQRGEFSFCGPRMPPFEELLDAAMSHEAGKV